jgi:hypothetical protein
VTPPGRSSRHRRDSRRGTAMGQARPAPARAGLLLLRPAAAKDAKARGRAGRLHLRAVRRVGRDSHPLRPGHRTVQRQSPPSPRLRSIASGTPCLPSRARPRRRDAPPSGSISHCSRDLTVDPRWPGRAGGARPPARLRNSESDPSRPLAVLVGLGVVRHRSLATRRRAGSLLRRCSRCSRCSHPGRRRIHRTRPTSASPRA